MQQFNNVTFNNIQYGQLVAVKRPYGYHAGVKVHFFNKRGVFIGNFYEWVKYSDLGLRGDYERMYLNKPFSGLRQWIYETVCKAVTLGIKFTQL